VLILSRGTGESIQIGDDITVTIVRIGPKQIRIGIEAPQATNITRTELRGIRKQPPAPDC
jgi:carbon storage regulator